MNKKSGSIVMSETAVNYDVSNSTDVTKKRDLIVCSRRQSFPSVGIFYGQNPMHYAFPLLMVELTVAVKITELVYFFLKPLKQPRIVAEIIGGTIVGQIAINSSINFRKYIFPADARFILRNIGVLGFMYFLFVSALKTDLRLIKRAGRKQWVVAVVSVFAPMVCGISLALCYRKSMGLQVSSIFGIAALFSVSSFSVVNPVVKELNLLSTETGRLAVSLTLITVVIGINFAGFFESVHQGMIHPLSGIWSFISFGLLAIGIFVVFRRFMYKLIKSTPPGKPIPEGYVVAILLGVSVTAFLSDVLGTAVCNGPMWIGLAIPDGPPLGSILVEKTETIVNNFLMPLGYVFLGMILDFSLIQEQWSSFVQFFFYIAIAVIVVKIIATYLVCYLVKIPVKDAAAISLLLGLRGQMEVLLMMRFTDLRMLTPTTNAVLLLLILVTNAISTPVVSMLCNPSKPYMVNKRRTIQHTPPNSQLRLVACFFDDTSVFGILNLLDLSTFGLGGASPICIYALHLIELVAQAQPIRIEHDIEDVDCEESSYTSLHRALENFKNSRRQDIEIHNITVITAKKTMYQDICEIALHKKVSLIVLPYQHELIPSAVTVTVTATSTPAESIPRNIRQVNNDVLNNAPCSVAIFANTGKNLRGMSKMSCEGHVIVLFLGGPDSREALTYADRITGNQNVTLTLIRFLSPDERGDDKLEKKLDDGLITWFWVKHETSQRVFYREVIVENGEATVSAVQDLATDDCQLFIVGRKQGINPVLIQGLTDWSENIDLGPLGDYIVSSELGTKASLIVIQQQILKG